MQLNNTLEREEKNTKLNEIESASTLRTLKTNRSTASDASFFENLWRSHARQILRITYRITKNTEDAEDALQDSFLKAYVHHHDFDGRSSFATWLTRIAINSSLMILRKRNSTSQVSIHDTGTDSSSPRLADLLPDHGPSPEANCAERERAELLRKSISALRPSMREAIELRAQERSVQEIAETMALSIPATKSRLFHAKAALRESLKTKITHRSRATRPLQLSTAY
jgi:RNA polymerase sigma-70 factor, ECF subfamily